MFALFIVLSAFVIINETNAAAIPMWEFLSKDEKMSYLYSTFANQVEEFCDYSDYKNCNQELLRFGLRKLKEMTEDHLDSMDPYQRGAYTLIWESFMNGHEMMKVTKRPRSTTTAKPNSYEDQSFNDFGSQSEASAKIETIYKVVAPPKDFVYPSQYNILSGTPLYKYPENNQFAKKNTKKPAFTETVDSNKDLDDPYEVSDNIESLPIREEYGQAPLTGPMVVKVYPDGSPVREKTEMPHDEDLKQYQRSKAKLPLF